MTPKHMSSRKLDQQGDNITTRPHLWATARCLTNLRGLVAAAAAVSLMQIMDYAGMLYVLFKAMFSWPEVYC